MRRIKLASLQRALAYFCRATGERTVIITYVFRRCHFVNPVRYFFIIALVGIVIGYAIYHYLPIWVFVLFVLINFMGLAILRGGSSQADRKHDEE